MGVEFSLTRSGFPSEPSLSSLDFLDMVRVCLFWKTRERTYEGRKTLREQKKVKKSMSSRNDIADRMCRKTFTMEMELIGEFVLSRTKCHKALSNKEHFDGSGQFLGPRIIAREGDRLVIKVVNNIHHNVTLHWYPVLVM
ncbi:unnamed protein product [Malus baccata var. baccata]